MKAVILAGGYGTRISEESHLKPKPMIEIGGMPILWHIMKIYSKYGINDFVICCGYKGEVIKNFFKKYTNPSWNVDLVDTGLDTMTGGRIKRIEKYVDDTFCLTYGDGLSDVNIHDLISFHKEKKSVGTLTAIHPPERFGVLTLSDYRVTEFNEKPQTSSGRISGGFFVCQNSIFNYLNKHKDNETLEAEPMRKIARDGEMMMYPHDGFWQCMETRRDYDLLNKLYEDNEAHWIKQ